MKDSGEVKFIFANSAELPSKRQQVSRACEPCRKKKRRCIHTVEIATRSHQKPQHADIETSVAAHHLLEFSSRESIVANKGDTQTSSSYLQDHSSSSDEPLRFIGDLNPEGILIEAFMTNKSKDFDYRGHTDIGVWYNSNTAGNVSQSLDRGQLEQGIDDKQLELSTTMTNPTTGATPSQIRPMIETYKEKYIEASVSYLAPPLESWKELRHTYLTKIHPILPVFEPSRIPGTSLASRPLGFPIKTDQLIDHLIVASICLSAAVDSAAAPFLKFSGSDSPDPVAYSDYSSSLVEFIRTASRRCEKKLDAYLLDYIRVLALTSFYWQPSPLDRHEPSIMFAEIISLVHTYGIHATGSKEQKTNYNKYTIHNRDAEKLFACLVAMDRINAALNGRAIMLSDRDLPLELHSWRKAPSTFEPGLCLLLLIVIELDTVIDLYRPRPTAANVIMPVFEALVLQAMAENESQPVLATLEVLYHAISVLSVRMDHSCFVQAPGTSDTMMRDQTGELKHLPDPDMNTRRSLSSDRILWIIQSHSVSPFPFIPYALSLSLGVAYRKWRFSRIPMFRARGRLSFGNILNTALNLNMAFTSLKRIQALAQLGFNEMGKVEAEVEERHRASKPTTPILSAIVGQFDAQLEAGDSSVGQVKKVSLDYSAPRSEQHLRDNQNSRKSSDVNVQLAEERPHLHSATTTTTTTTDRNDRNIHHNSQGDDSSQNGHQNTLLGGSLHHLNSSPSLFPPLTDHGPSLDSQGSREAPLLGLAVEVGWNQSVAEVQSLNNNTLNRTSLPQLQILIPESPPEDLFTMDLFPDLDPESPHYQIDCAFSSNLDPSSGPKWLNMWWDNEFVPMG
ncbi:hypothetical protein BX600DRAFT_527288 [Xylariales sp. PMI_506]|nr:hypothetical protein BX600DRAFT_527288 [Xylariales sp. PMI_506]